MYFFQAFVGLPGSLNDMNIMGQTNMQDNYMEYIAIDHKFILGNQEFTLGNQEFTTAYFLADGIYLDYPFLMKNIPVPLIVKEKNYSRVQ